jgi:hypothetical protein
MDLDMFFYVFFMGLEMVLAKIVKTIVNFSSFWLKNDSIETLVAFTFFFYFFYDFGTVPPQNRKEIEKKIVDFSSFWLKTRFCGPWLHLRFFTYFSILLQNQVLWWEKASGKGKLYQNRLKSKIAFKTIKKHIQNHLKN